MSFDRSPFTRPRMVMEVELPGLDQRRRGARQSIHSQLAPDITYSVVWPCLLPVTLGKTRRIPSNWSYWGGGEREEQVELNLWLGEVCGRKGGEHIPRPKTLVPRRQRPQHLPWTPKWPSDGRTPATERDVGWKVAEQCFEGKTKKIRTTSQRTSIIKYRSGRWG